MGNFFKGLLSAVVSGTAVASGTAASTNLPVAAIGKVAILGALTGVVNYLIHSPLQPTNVNTKTGE